jgi:hypothetical protein
MGLCRVKSLDTKWIIGDRKMDLQNITLKTEGELWFSGGMGSSCSSSGARRITLVSSYIHVLLEMKKGPGSL